MERSLCQNVIFVNVHNPNPIQNGASWETAFTSLQSALDVAATSGMETTIWIAAGTYVPTKIYSPNGIPGGAFGVPMINLLTFNLPNNVALVGGFCGNETKLSDRDITTHPTILNGVGVSWHVVIAGNDVAQTGVNVILDGLTITGGNAFGPFGFNPVFEPLTYAHSYGAGIYAVFGSTLEIRQVTFVNNSASGVNGVGGGLMSNNCNVVITKCYFHNNMATEEGGAIEILNTYETSPHTSLIDSCVFDQNLAAYFGGAIVIEGTFQNTQSMSEVRKCIFEKNSAQIGGAIAVDSIRVILTECVFNHNFAAVSGGALSTSNIVNTLAAAFNSPATLTLYPTTICNSIFNQNVAAGNVPLHDVLFGGLAAGLDFPIGGGALVCYLNGRLNVDTSRFINNESQNSNGGAILNGRSAAQNPLGIPISVFSVETRIRQCKFINNRVINGRGSAIASQPSTFVFTPPLTIPISGTVLEVVASKFKGQPCIPNESVIYVNTTTVCFADNCFTFLKPETRRDDPTH
jgi:predicted outer membrane repeat protein